MKPNHFNHACVPALLQGIPMKILLALALNLVVNPVSITFGYSRGRPGLRDNLPRMHLLQHTHESDTNCAPVAALRP